VLLMATIYDRPSIMSALAAAIECWPTVQKKLLEGSQRSDKIEKARRAFVDDGDVETAVAVLGDLVAKSGDNPLVKLPEGLNSERSEFNRDTLLAKRAQLLELRDRIRIAKAQISGAGKHNIGGHQLANESDRKAMLQDRLNDLKAKLNQRLDPRRNWTQLEARS
jgi:hypothetical protein